MNPFVINRVECKIAAFKGDGESHGDKEKKCVDLTLTITGDITVLQQLDPDLVDALTKLVDPKDAADGLFKGDKVMARRVLRFPKVGTIPWDLECIGRDVIFEHGIDDKSAINLKGCNLNKFKFTLEAGVRVELQFHLRAFPDERNSGTLWSKIHEKAIVSVMPPAQKALPIGEGAKAAAPASDASAADTKASMPPADSGQAFPDAIDGTGNADGWPFPTRPDDTAAGATA